MKIRKGLTSLSKATSEEIQGKTIDSLAVYRWTREVALGIMDFEDVPAELKMAVRGKLINNYIRYAPTEIPCKEIHYDQ